MAAGGFGRAAQSLQRRLASPACHPGHAYRFNDFLAQQTARITSTLDKSERRIIEARRRAQTRGELGDVDVEIRGSAGSDVATDDAAVQLRRIGAL